MCRCCRAGALPTLVASRAPRASATRRAHLWQPSSHARPCWPGLAHVAPAGHSPLVTISAAELPRADQATPPMGRPGGKAASGAVGCGRHGEQHSTHHAHEVCVLLGALRRHVYVLGLLLLGLRGASGGRAGVGRSGSQRQRRRLAARSGARLRGACWGLWAAARQHPRCAEGQAARQGARAPQVRTIAPPAACNALDRLSRCQCTCQWAAGRAARPDEGPH